MRSETPLCDIGLKALTLEDAPGGALFDICSQS
jgi:hypothetical protein